MERRRSTRNTAALFVASAVWTCLAATDIGTAAAQTVGDPTPLGAPDPVFRIPDMPRQSLGLSIGQGQVIEFGETIDRLLLADPAVADVEVISRQVVYVFGRTPGRTDLFAVTGDDRVAAIVDVRVTPQIGAAERDLRARHPQTGARFHLIGDEPVATGEVVSLGEASDVAQAMQALAPDRPALNRTVLTGSQQVQLRVRFAEVTRTDIYRFGINWDALLDIDEFAFGLVTGSFLPGAAINPADTFGTASLAFAGGDLNLDLLIDALQSEGVVNVLAEPNLTARNGEVARFLAGGEFPIPVPEEDGAVTIEFREFGVSLAFLPTLLPHDRIGLRVRPEVSTLVMDSGIEFAGFSIPALTVRRTETSVELASGQTFAIAGLFQRNLSNDLDQLPLLGDLPILGRLFQSVRYQNEETELVILITPFLVEPSRTRDLATPLDPPLSDLDDGSSASRSRDRLVGFIID